MNEDLRKWAVTYRKHIGDKMYTPQIGVALEYNNRIEVKLDSMPVPEFWRDGTLVLFPFNNRED